MNRNLNALGATEFDVLVVGAGITGAWIALDCTQRGLRVALIDRADFGAETSAKSSKILHGGIRYLQQFQFGRVRESASERACYHQVAPHLSHYISFLI
ncbi:MAG: FAD-dependent oxidoreductase, partial [Gammaproteobacteria bacterium]